MTAVLRFFEFGREFPAQAFGDARVLQDEGALEILAAMPSRAQHKMSVEQRARIAKHLKHLGVGHAFTTHFGLGLPDCWISPRMDS